jgi:hypothetical protein
MDYINQQKTESERWKNYLTQLSGPLPENPVIKIERDLRDLD